MTPAKKEESVTPKAPVEKPSKYDRSGRVIADPNPPTLVEVDHHIAKES